MTDITRFFIMIAIIFAADISVAAAADNGGFDGPAFTNQGHPAFGDVTIPERINEIEPAAGVESAESAASPKQKTSDTEQAKQEIPAHPPQPSKNEH